MVISGMRCALEGGGGGGMQGRVRIASNQGADSEDPSLEKKSG